MPHACKQKVSIMASMSTSNVSNKILHHVERLRTLRDLALIDSPEEMVYDKLTRLASEVIGAPVSLVSMVAADYQFFKSQVGLPDPWKSKRRTPLSHSFCQHVVTTQQPLVVSDAREVDFLKHNRAIPDLNVIGYLGMPLTLSDGKSLGSFCVIDSEPREWLDIEIEIMRELSEIVCNEFDVRADARNNPSMKIKLEELDNAISRMVDDLTGIDNKGLFLATLRGTRQRYGV